MPEPGGGLVLVGLPGSGKTTVGRLVAERLGRPFVDTDDLIAAGVGMPAAEYLRARGEEAFRAVEGEAIRDAVADPAAVVAPGAGALADPLVRWRLWEHGRAVWLRAPDRTLLARLAADGTPRPLLEGAPAERLAELAERRAPFYRAADAVIDAGPPPERVAGAVVAAVDAPPSVDRRLFDAEEPRHHPIGPERARIVFGHGVGSGVVGEAIDAIGGTARLVADHRAAMALDHRRVLAQALGRIRGKLQYRPVVFELLPPEFTLGALQRLVEALAGARLHTGNFRRLLDRSGVVEGVGRHHTGTGGRPAELHRFRREVVLERPAPGVGLPGMRTAG